MTHLYQGTIRFLLICLVGGWFSVALANTQAVRYHIIEDGSVVRDNVTGLEWQRCFVGQTWNGSSCDGSATYYYQNNFSGSPNIPAPPGFSLPTLEQLRTLVYCSNTGSYDSNGDDLPCDSTSSYERPTLNTDFLFDDASYGSSVWGLIDAGAGVASVEFDDGDVNFRSSGGGHVRLVRGASWDTMQLRVNFAGTGSGRVVFEHDATECDASCSKSVPYSKRVQLTAYAGTGSSFNGWDGCERDGDDAYVCDVVVNNAQSVTVHFEDATTGLIDNRYLPIDGGSVIRDEVTGLEWQRCLYGQTWDGSECSGSAEYVRVGDLDTVALPEGFRVASVDELRSLVYCSNTRRYDSNGNDEACGAKLDYFAQPTLNSEAFPAYTGLLLGIPRYGNVNNFMQEVNFGEGSVTAQRPMYSATSRNIWLVRTGAPGTGVAPPPEFSQADYAYNERYQVIENGAVVRDLETGLDWQRCPVGQQWNGSTCVGNPLFMSFDQATSLAEPGGFVLPSQEQLLTLVNCGDNCGAFGSISRPTIDTTLFPLDNRFYTYKFWAEEGAAPGPPPPLPLAVSFASGLPFAHVSRGIDDLLVARLVRPAQPQQPTQLTVNVSGADNGSVIRSQTGRIHCGDICAAEFELGQEVTLIADLIDFAEVAKWEGCENSDGLRCTVQLTNAKQVSVTIREQRFQPLGDGSLVRDAATGLEWARCSVGQTWNGVSCEGTAQLFDWNALQNYTPPGGFEIPAMSQLRTLIYCSNLQEYDFALYNIACGPTGNYDGTDYYIPTLNDEIFSQTAGIKYWSRSVWRGYTHSPLVANFNTGRVDIGRTASDTYGLRLVRAGSVGVTRLNVSVTGSGQGVIENAEYDINCEASCSYSFEPNTLVKLLAPAGEDSRFVKWHGCIQASTASCWVETTSVHNITAEFASTLEPPVTPYAVAATAVTSNSFLARWNYASRANSYVITVSYDAEGSQPVAGFIDVNVGNNNQFSVDGLNPNTEYFYRVRAVNSGGSSGWSQAIAVTTEAIMHTVTFIDWDERVLVSVRVEHGLGVEAPVTPTRAGHTFTGWSHPLDSITADLTVQAQYDINVYTVRFLDWDGTLLDSQQVTYGDDAVAPTSPSRVGYTFVGWQGSLVGVNENRDIVANYQVIMLSVTVTAGNTGGVVETGVYDVAWGNSVAVGVQPNAGMHVVLPVQGTCPSGRIVNGSYVVRNIVNDCALHIEFTNTQPRKRRSSIILKLINEL